MDSEKPSTRHFPGGIGDEPEERRHHDLRWISLARSKPASSDTIGVLVIPPGTSTLTVMPVPSRSFAMIALSASSAALDGPYVGEPAFNIVPRLVVTLMIRPQPSRIISGTTAFASAKGAVVCTATKRRH